jgi:hypothetical protein
MLFVKITIIIVLYNLQSIFPSESCNILLAWVGLVMFSSFFQMKKLWPWEDFNQTPIHYHSQYIVLSMSICKFIYHIHVYNILCLYRRRSNSPDSQLPSIAIVSCLSLCARTHYSECLHAF